MSPRSPSTRSAPAEREEATEVDRQASGVLALSLLRQLTEALPDPLLILNDKRQIVFANQRLADLLATGDPTAALGLRPGEVLGCPRADETAGGCGTSEACQHCGVVLAILSSQQGKAEVRECRIARHGSGPALNLRLHATPFDVEGRRYTLFCLSDVSAEKRQRVLERVLFHELLTQAREFHERITSRPEAELTELQALGQEARRFTEGIIEEINAHRILVAAERGELTIHPAPLGAVAVLREVIRFYEKRPEARGKRLRLHPRARDTAMVTDPVLLRQVLGTMVANALEASPEQGTVTLHATGGIRGVELSVHNPGFMPREAQLQVFQRGYSTKDEDRGMGTYAMKLLGEQYLRGRVSFRSGARLGTVFRIALPVTL
jgi:nitrogen fixation/metabolism regulation signal transduction histidine kinase